MRCICLKRFAYKSNLVPGKSSVKLRKLFCNTLLLSSLLSISFPSVDIGWYLNLYLNFYFGLSLVKSIFENHVFGIPFLKILFPFRAWKFFIFVHTFQWTSSSFFFLIFGFSCRLSQSQQKLANKITHFTILRSKNLWRDCLKKCFTIFHFYWNFWKFNHFSAFR